MPFITGLGDPISGLTSVITAGDDAFSTSGPIWEQTPFLRVIANGAELDHVKTATVVTGLDITVASAQIELTENPEIPNDSVIVVIAGTGPHNVQRFRGLVKRTRARMWPHVFTLVCRGMLSRADEYKQAINASDPTFINQRLPIVGLGFYDLLGDAEGTDENYVLKILNRVPGLSVDPGDIHGTGHVFGSLAWRDLSWAPNVSALAQAQRLDEVCLGYRLFEGPSGTIYRVQVFGYPTGTSDTTFTEGVDVLDANGERSIENLINAEYVEGYALGGNPGLINAFVAEDNDFQSADDPHIDPFSSPFIEDDDFALQVANWRLGERNRETVSVQLVTFRDDLIIPGRTIAVNIPHANVTEPVWVNHVELFVRAQPVLFQQTISGIGGGEPGDYSPPNTP